MGTMSIPGLDVRPSFEHSPLHRCQQPGDFTKGARIKIAGTHSFDGEEAIVLGFSTDRRGHEQLYVCIAPRYPWQHGRPDYVRISPANATLLAADKQPLTRSSSSDDDNVKWEEERAMFEEETRSIIRLSSLRAAA